MSDNPYTRQREIAAAYRRVFHRVTTKEFDADPKRVFALMDTGYVEVVGHDGKAKLGISSGGGADLYEDEERAWDEGHAAGKRAERKRIAAHIENVIAKNADGAPMSIGDAMLIAATQIRRGDHVR